MNDYANLFLGRVFFGAKKLSTMGMGKLASQALYKANKIIKAQKQSSKVTNNKMNVPYVKNIGCYAELAKSNNSKFDYWVFVSNQWGGDRVAIPAKSHKALNKSLREGWQFASLCECKLINGNLYAIVFVKKIVPNQKRRKKIIGYDVGIKHSVVSSTGYLGHGLSKIIKVQKKRQSARRRQGHKVSSKVKTCVKQVLDIEAKRAVHVALNSKANIGVESPKRLSNISRGKLQYWAGAYFANRLTILGKESGITVIEISPYQTSITCPKCGNVDKQNRVTRDIFSCVKCRFTEHADKVAALNIAYRASQKSGGKK